MKVRQIGPETFRVVDEGWLLGNLVFSTDISSPFTRLLRRIAPAYYSRRVARELTNTFPDIEIIEGKKP